MITASCMGERTRFRNCHFQSSHCETDTPLQGSLPILLPPVNRSITTSDFIGKEELHFLLSSLSTRTSEDLRVALPSTFFNPDGLVNAFKALR